MKYIINTGIEEKKKKKVREIVFISFLINNITNYCNNI